MYLICQLYLNKKKIEIRREVKGHTLILFFELYLDIANTNLKQKVLRKCLSKFIMVQFIIYI